jgi:hypothetical protein
MPIVATIWGYAIYVYLFADHAEGQVTSTPAIAALPAQPIASTVVDTYSLLLHYPDPFLGTGSPQPLRFSSDFDLPAAEASPPAAPAKPSSPAPQPAPLVPSSLLATQGAIRYGGLIQQSGTSNLVGILRIEGKTHFVNVGTLVRGITVTAMTPDSIGLREQDATLTIGRR